MQVPTGHLTLFILYCCLTQHSHADIAVISSTATPAMSKDYIEKIYMNRIRELPNGGRAIPLDLPEDDERRVIFYKQLANRDSLQLKAYWSRLIFTGSGKPPKVLENSDEIKAFIANNSNAIGYIDSHDVDASVKVQIILH